MPAALALRLIFWLWFGAALVAGRTLFLQRLPPPAVQAILFGLTGLVLASYFRLRLVREWIDALDLRTLVLLHVTRFVGIAFLIMHRRGELPYAFAVPGGIGDIIVATLALPVALAPLEEHQRQRVIVIWNVIGLVDILLVVLTAIRLNLADPAQLVALTRLPLSLLPTFLVPLIIATHVIIFARVARLRQAD
ncbi:MAG TPA: hypothetical protein VHD62_02145 [Opitutaceae bacterium]|nr:hypothetical protein [Opitutaceae bacterium]